MEKKYSSPFCKNDTYNETKCFAKYYEREQEFGTNCKRSCSNLEYSGDFEGIAPHHSKVKGGGFYQIHYLINKNFPMKVYEEYLIYDIIGMIGSVGGTLGAFLI